MAFGIYVHFPYCLQRCPYCDFALVVARQIDHRRFGRAVVEELHRRAPAFQGRVARSIYFGGGTPSLWDPTVVAEVISAIRDAFPFEKEVEITLEANPDASDAGRFEAYRRIGVNRLSIGIQSFQPQVLKALGRTHSGEAAAASVQTARAAGFENVTVDLMFGSPGETRQMAHEDASRAVDLAPDHVSAYALTLENLAFEVRMARDVRLGRMAVPGQDDAAEQGEAIREVLGRGGYRRYEISNFARPGFESRHNLLYWRGDEYLGLGAGACGFHYNDPARPSGGGVRYANRRSPMRYLDDIDRGGLGEDRNELLGSRDLLRERVMLGLRLTDGFDLDAACTTFGQDPAAFQEPLAQLAKAGLAVARGGWLTLTERGLDVHTEAAVRLM